MNFIIYFFGGNTKKAGELAMKLNYKGLDSGRKKRMLITFFIYVIIGLFILTSFSLTLLNERFRDKSEWGSYLTDKPENAALAQTLSANATPVKVGTYIENLREINMKSSYYRVEFLVWFSWEGGADINPASNFRVYKGIINKQNIVKESHENGKNYQLVNMDVTVSKNFKTIRFPLESHQMRLYVESTYPIQQVVYVPDQEASGINPNLTISGFEFSRHDIGGVTFLYDSTHGDPEIQEYMMTSEIVTMFEINRSNYGLYFKCFIALAGTILWALIAMFLSSQHHVDPLGMLPGALFGAVANIMVGANLLPDALDTGLLEFVNIWGVFTILAVSIVIINVNRIRNKYGDNDYAHFYGTVMFYTILAFTVVGNIILPISAYIGTPPAL